MQDLEELFTEGQFKFMDEEFEEAIAIFSEIIVKNPSFGRAYQARAIAKLRLGDGDAAIEDINRAIECEPENPKFHYHKGAILLKNEILDQALESLSTAIDIDPAYAAAYMLRGHVFEKAGDEERASADTSKAMNLRREQTKNSQVVDF